MSSLILTVTDTSGLADARREAAVASRDVLGDDRTTDVALAVSELVTNALSYGSGDVEVGVESVDGTVVVTVSSDAVGVPAPADDRIPADQIAGRGLQIVHHLADAVDVTRDGDRVSVVCRFGT